jgi:ABC-type multidrug transport system fused ATPase/permease subunit
MKKSFHIIKNVVLISNSVIKKSYYILFILSVITAVIPILSMFNTQFLINFLQLKEASFLNKSFLISLFLFLIFQILSELCNIILVYKSTIYSEQLNLEYSNLLLKKIGTHSLDDFEDPEFYNLIQRAEHAGGIYPNSIMSGLISLSTSFFSTISFIFILVSWKPWVIFFIAIFPILSSFQVISLSKNEYQIFHNRTNLERKSWYYAHLINKGENIKETILNSLQDLFYRKFNNIRIKFLKENKALNKKRSSISFLIQLISTIASFFVVMVIFKDAISGIILIGSVMTLISSLNNYKLSLHKLTNVIYKLYQDSLYADNILQILKDFEYSDSKKDENKIEINSINSIELKKVSFKYKHAKIYAIKNINLELNKGDSIVIVGQNGSGKSTFSKLLLGFYQNYEGSILINGIELRDIDKASYRACTAALFQDFTKYQFTIADSITLSDFSNSSDTNIVNQVITLADANAFINKLPGKNTQQVGTVFENGVQLSGGEWQKIAIARTFFKKKADFIILDEPSSSLDPLSESIIYKNYQTHIKKKISIYITHKLKNLAVSGQVIVLKNGSIVESGDFKTLMKNKGLFFQMYTAQNKVGK